MKNHFLIALCAVLVSLNTAHGQTPGGGSLTPEQLSAGEKTYTEAPTLGAWWHTGKLPAGTTDLTGVWFGGASGDLSENTTAGQEMVLTPLGYERYKNVDHATDPNAFCLPPGPARMFMMAHPGMIIQRPDVVAILSESQRTFRLIYTDGRGHHPEAWDYPEWMGSSIGKWEGDTLVVETIAINDRTWLDTSGHEHSNKLRLTERFRLADANTLEHTVTYDDPVFFVKPFTTRKTFRRQVGDRIMDHSCLENEKDTEHMMPTLGGTGLERARTAETPQR